jgi:hypothetical protein
MSAQSKPQFSTILLLSLTGALVIGFIILCTRGQSASKIVYAKKDLRDSIARAQVDSMEAAAAVNQVKMLAADIAAFRVSQYRESAQAGAAELQRLAESVIRAEQDSAHSRDAKAWRKSLASIQAKAYPALRQYWIKEADQLLWRQDIDVTGGGQSVTFAGGAFAANQNISDFYSVNESALVALRFKRANFKWYSGATEYEYYTIESPKDTDVQ